MRFILTLLIWLVIIGGLWSYSRQRQAAEAEIVIRNPTLTLAKEVYSLKLTPTFSSEADPFALQTEDSGPVALELRLNGRLLPVPADQLNRGIPWTLEGVEGLVMGDNEIYLAASPPLSEGSLEHGMRVQLARAGVRVVDTTLWSSQGSLVSGTIHFALTAKEESHDH
ncbi:hypothetical protein [Desulfogranum mediterraneum]|uniref:hypothetical protein n=1 Tax=Desulfogranum mediterraneum TaxID=160661 RepID=UPI000423AC30|nr:hypothetical protein [Desulfogranum mediterraneum]